MQSDKTNSIWVVCPAYNEASTIVQVVTGLRRGGYHVVAVDDGSTDQTRQLARGIASAVVCHPVNLGQGAALKTGIDFALAQGADVIVTFDTDGQHRPSDIPRLLDALARNRADFALGSRFLNPPRRCRACGACCGRRPCLRLPRPACG
jgi:polyprenyl-phospho-N-acetylgalactosaminyl synthase